MEGIRWEREKGTECAETREMNLKKKLINMASERLVSFKEGKRRKNNHVHTPIHSHKNETGRNKIEQRERDKVCQSKGDNWKINHKK
jgi:hypothetical protein